MNLLPREQMLRLIVVEAVRRRWLILVAFMLICGTGVAVGMEWPKSYSANVTIYVEQQNIIDPLMEGRAVRTGVADMARNAREFVYNRSLMTEAVHRTGRVDEDASSDKVEEELMAVQSRTTVTNPGSNLIRIEYRGGNPEDTFHTAETLGELFISEMLRLKERESKAAFEFIDSQVKKYEQELQGTQDELKALRRETPLAQPGAAEQLSARASSLRDQIDALEQDLQETRIREQSMEEQLSGEAEVSAIETREERYRSRINELRDDLETLRLSYHETYPDVVRLKQQIADLQQQLRNAESGETPDSSDESARGSDLYQTLQRDLYDVRTRIKTLEARLANSRQNLENTEEQINTVQAVHGEIAKLQQDYQVNQDIYEDLLRRRENARVSQNLDSEQQGLTIRIQEPAYMPHSAEGPSMTQFALAGGVLGLAAPLGLLIALLNLDPRIRHPAQLSVEVQHLMLENVPHWHDRYGRRREIWKISLTVLTAVVFVAVMAGLMWYEATGGQ